MNLVAMHRALDTPWTADLRAALLVVTPTYRPVGGLFYRALYSAFSFDAASFRAAAHTLLLLNLIAAFFLFRMLHGSDSAPLFALVPLAFHPVFIDFYANTGTAYDLLCFLFYALSLIAFLALWRRAAAPGWYLLPLALYAAALGSKEMAVSLPVVILILLFPSGASRWKDLALRLAPFVLLTAAYAALKLSPQGGLTANPSYNPQVSLFRFAVAMRHYVGAFFVEGRELNAAETLALFGVFLFSALALRCYSALRFALCAAAALLPVAFIDLRAPFAAWVACAFATLALGALASAFLDRLPEKRRRAALAFSLVLFLGLYTLWVWPWRARVFDHAGGDAAPLRSTFEAIRAAKGELAPGSRTLVLDLPLPSYEEHVATYFARLLFHDPSIELLRSPSSCAPPHPPCAAAFRFSDSTLGRLPPDSVTSGNLR